MFGTVWATAAFFVFTATKEIKPIYNHAPWLNDPYDTFISFTMFFVPLVTACLLVPVSLCLRSEPLTTVRVVAILRACRVAIAAIVVDLTSGWVAVAVGANRPQWTVPATGVEIGLLTLATAVTIAVTVSLLRTPRLSSARLPDPVTIDWFGDAVIVAKRQSRWFGPLRPLIITISDWSEHSLVKEVRRHPIIAAATASASFGVAVFGWQGYREAYSLPVTLLAMALGFCGMFAFLVSAGAYFGLVRSTQPSYGLPRRMVDSSVIACATATVTLAFRNSLWWIVGSSANAAGPAQFALLVGSAALVVFIVVAIVETVLRSHPRPKYQS